MRGFHDTSIRRKMTLVIVFTSAIALLLATAAAVGYEFLRFHRDKVVDLAAQAKILETNSAPALAARDVKTVSEILSGLRTQHEVVSARVFDRNGALFAEYVKPDATALPIVQPAQTEGYRFQGHDLLFYSPIKSGGQTIGTLILRTNIQKLQDRFKAGAGILVVVMLASVLTAVLVAGRMQRIISRPILELARVARTVAVKKDYSLRATRTSDDEIGFLTESFNQMLGQIQTQDAELRASEQRFRQLAESIREVFWISDPAGKRIIYISPAYEEIWGRSCASLYAAPHDWVDAIHPEDRHRVLEAVRSRQSSGRYNEEYRVVRPDGSIRWVHDRGFPVRNDAGKVYRIVGIAEDVTERKKLEKRLLEVTDREQARIGQDIHDGLCQQLVGASFNVALLREDLPAQAPMTVERADRIATLLNTAISQARNLAGGLYPVKLETEGLLSALRELALGVTNQFAVSCEVECPQPNPVGDQAVALHLYRIATEAVSNALKHSGASRVVISLTVDNDTACMTVSDDGMGIAFGSHESGGMGLHIMKYRADMIGGTLSIRRNDNGGTIISCVFEQNSLTRRFDQGDSIKLYEMTAGSITL